jgi:hypothetical protein
MANERWVGGAPICRPGRQVWGAAHPSDPAAVNCALAQHVTSYSFSLSYFSLFLFIVLFIKTNILHAFLCFQILFIIFYLIIFKLFDFKFVQNLKIIQNLKIVQN